MLSTWITSLAFAVATYRFELTQLAVGKAAFLAHEALRYDTESLRPMSIPIELFVAACFFLGIYELLSFAIDRAIIGPILDARKQRK